MKWIEIRTVDDAENIKRDSMRLPDESFVIFKNSTRCGTSRMAKNLFASEWNSEAPVFLVNVIEHRDASDFIASSFGVHHESPQLLVIRNDKCIYHTSHSGIDARKVIKITSEPLR